MINIYIIPKLYSIKLDFLHRNYVNSTMNWKVLKAEEDYNKASMRMMGIFHT